MIEQWYQADTRGQLQPVPRMSTTLACVEAPRQVAVWKQVPNAHCKEEEEWRRRNSEDAPMPVAWLGGDIVDEVFLRSTTGQNTGGVNLGEWGWHYAVTDSNGSSTPPDGRGKCGRAPHILHDAVTHLLPTTYLRSKPSPHKRWARAHHLCRPPTHDRDRGGRRGRI